MVPIRQSCLHSQSSVPLGAGSGAGASCSAPLTGGVSGTGTLPSTRSTDVLLVISFALSGSMASPLLLWQAAFRPHFNISFKPLLCFTER